MADYNPRMPGRMPVDPDRCRAEVWDQAWPWASQCQRRARPGERYCYQHHPDEIAKRRAARDEKHEAEMIRMKRRALEQTLGRLVLEHGIKTEEELRARLGPRLGEEL